MKYLGIALVYAWRYTFGLLDPAGTLQVPPELLAVRDRRAQDARPLKGSVLAGWRLLRCNPWSHGGVDYAENARLFRRREDERPV